MIKTRKPLPEQLENIKQRLINQVQPSNVAKLREHRLKKIEPTWRCR